MFKIQAYKLRPKSFSRTFRRCFTMVSLYFPHLFTAVSLIMMITPTLLPPEHCVKTVLLFIFIYYFSFSHSRFSPLIPNFLPSFPIRRKQRKARNDASSINSQIPANRTKSGFSDNPKTKIYTRQGDRDDGFVRMTKPKTRHVGQIPVFVNKREIVNDLRFVNTPKIVNTLSFSIL